MMLRTRMHVLTLVVAAWALTTALVQAQSPEPAVDTSAPRARAPAARPSGSVPAATPAGGEAAGADAGAKAARQRPANRVMDRLELDASQITGNRELPRVLYIVPWRAPNPGDLEGRPVNSLLYELTKPVDRDVFRRENRYFDALAASPAAAGPAPAGPSVRDTSQPRPTSGN